MSKKGFFITFEGIDGTGKTTQLRLLSKRFMEAGFDVLVTKEPGDMIDGKRVGSDIGPTVRHLIMKYPGSKNMAAGVNDALFLADHIQVTEMDIRPALAEGKVVLCDRYADSQFAYGSSGGKNSPQWSLDAYQANFDLVPDVTVLFIVQAEDAVEGGKSMGWISHRTKRVGTSEEGKQDGKKWAGEDSQGAIQVAYINRLIDLPRTLPIYLQSSDTVDQVNKYLWQCLCIRMQQVGVTAPARVPVEMSAAA